MPSCSVDGCDAKTIAKQLCSKHYQRYKKHGDPLYVEFEVKTRKAIDHEDGTRTCPECKQRLNIEDFHKDSRATRGRRARCSKCHTGAAKNWYAINQPRQKQKALIRRIVFGDKIRKQDSERYERDKPKRLELASKHSQIRRARKVDAKFDKGISRKSLRKKFGVLCYYCKIEMDFSGTTKEKGYKDDHATIEHLIPLSKGGTHTWENVVLACRKCNISKSSKLKSEWDEHKRKSEGTIQDS